MTAEQQSNEHLADTNFAEVYKMLQKGEVTAKDLEKKLDYMESTLDQLLAQMAQPSPESSGHVNLDRAHDPAK